MNISQTPAPVSINQVRPEDLHNVWGFVRQGIETVIRKVKPDFMPEDVYAAVRANNALLFLVTRGSHTLGFFVTYSQRRPFSNRLEYFLWCAYSIPFRERLPDDNVSEAVTKSVDFMQEQARALGCDSVVMLSTRKGFQKFGFKAGFTTWRMAV